ncbi:MAG: 3'-5' exonuclease [bacterium]|nr:3'-5' exonuclease [bacterium]
MQNLHLTRPLVVFDLETTGIDVEKDRIVQIGMIRVEPGGERTDWESLVNPERPIPPEATAVHGISDDDVRDAPTFSQLRAEVEGLLDGADLAGYNSVRFDQPLLEQELARAGSQVDLKGVRHLDAMRIFHTMERRDLTAAYRFYCDQELVGAHGALPDAKATLEVLDAQIARYDEVPAEVDALHKFCNPNEGKWIDRTRKLMFDDKGEAVFTFGKLRGQPLKTVVQNDRGYLEWMLNKDFSEELKGILRDALAGVFPQKRV